MTCDVLVYLVIVVASKSHVRGKRFISVRDHSSITPSESSAFPED